MHLRIYSFAKHRNLHSICLKSHARNTPHAIICPGLLHSCIATNRRAYHLDASNHSSLHTVSAFAMSVRSITLLLNGKPVAVSTGPAVVAAVSGRAHGSLV